MAVVKHPRLASFTDHLREKLSPDPVQTRQNRNRVTYLSHVLRQGVHHVSVHGVFLDAPEEIWSLVARFCRRADSRIRMALDDFVESVPADDWARHARKDRSPLEPLGDVHDLNDAVSRAVDLGFNGVFPGELPDIGWGRRSAPSRHVRLGSYHETRHAIRINPLLDSPRVPLDYIAAVVHHELLHALHRPIKSGGRRIVHTPEFKKAERRFPLYGWAVNWEKTEMDRLLRRRSRSS